MAATIYSDHAVIVENVSTIPKSAAKIAAAFLVLQPYPYVVGKDLPRVSKSQVFSEPEVFMQQQKTSKNVVLAFTGQPYNVFTDVRRQPQAKVFSEPETFPQEQNPFLATVFTIQPQQPAGPGLTAQISVETVSLIKSWKGTLVVLNVAPAVAGPADVLMGHDTYGWPPDNFDWILGGQRVTSLVSNTNIIYNPSIDRRALQARVFSDFEPFPQFWRNYTVINNTIGYSVAADVTRLRAQAKVFSDPEVFQRQAPIFAALPSTNFVIYNPSTDVRRRSQAQAFADYDSFPLPFHWHFWRPVLDGLVLVSPLEFATGIDIYDYLNGSVLLAWGQFNPNPQSYNIYQRTVNFTPNFEPANAPPGGAFGPSAQSYFASFGPWIPAVGVFLNALNFKVTGLTIASYNPATQVQTASQTYEFKVVAVINGVERGAIDRRVTPGPQSIMLRTAMKRLWPFPNTGLD